MLRNPWHLGTDRSVDSYLLLTDPDLLYSSVTFKTPAKCFLLLPFEGTFTSFFKVIKKSQKSRNQGFLNYFCLMIEGSGFGYGYGSGRPKNLRVFIWKAVSREEQEDCCSCCGSNTCSHHNNYKGKYLQKYVVNVKPSTVLVFFSLFTLKVLFYFQETKYLMRWVLGFYFLFAATWQKYGLFKMENGNT